MVEWSAVGLAELAELREHAESCEARVDGLARTRLIMPFVNWTWMLLRQSSQIDKSLAQLRDLNHRALTSTWQGMHPDASHFGQ